MSEQNDRAKNEYDEFLASVYDYAPTFGRWKNRNLDQVNTHYLDGARQMNGVILEFGTATGMLTIALAREGYNVTSVDLSEDMHDILRGKLRNEEGPVSERIHLVIGDALDCTFDRPFDMVAIPDGLFIAIANQKLQMKFLRNCHRNLRNGGRLYFDIAMPQRLVTPKTELLFARGCNTVHSRFQAPSGERYMVKLDIMSEPYGQHCDFNYEFTNMSSTRDEKPKLVNISYRYVYYGELVLMLEQSGFKVIDIDTETFKEGMFFVTAEKC